MRLHSSSCLLIRRDASVVLANMDLLHLVPGRPALHEGFGVCYLGTRHLTPSLGLAWRYASSLGAPFRMLIEAVYIYLITNFANLAILGTVVWSVLAEVVVNVRPSVLLAFAWF